MSIPILQPKVFGLLVLTAADGVKIPHYFHSELG
jgi:hypothetical protein